MTTIKDIAKLANVSVTTVSKVINDYSDISPETKRLVLKIIDENNYRPNANARTLSTNKSYSIGIFFKDHQNSGLHHPFFREVIYGLEREFSEYGYDLILFSSKWGDKFKYLEKCKHRNVDGAILMGMPKSDGDLNELTKSNIPAVFVDLDIDGDNATYVMSDNVKGAIKAINYFVKLGHQKIGMITGEKMTKPAQDRLTGYKKALKSNGLNYNKNWVIEGEFSETGGYNSMKKIIDLNKQPTAIFCQGDKIAFGAIKAINESEYRVPDDYSIIGFDDIEISSYIEPQLTTIHQDKFKMGKTAAELLIKIINNPAMKYSPAIIPTRLVKRRSCTRL